MTNAVKNKNKETKQGQLVPPPDGQQRQADITGTKTLKQTPTKEVREACECYFSKKEDANLAKNNLDKAKERILSEMRKAKITLVTVKDNDGIPRRVHITAEEKLKIEKDLE